MREDTSTTGQSGISTELGRLREELKTANGRSKKETVGGAVAGGAAGGVTFLAVLEVAERIVGHFAGMIP